MAWWNRRRSASARVGLELLPDGLALVCANAADRGSGIATVAMLPCVGEQRQEVLADFVKQYSLQSFPCNLVLSPDQYQLLLVEAPQVAADEMRAAVRWRLKDLINIPLDKAVVDVFELPSDATRSGKRMIFAVVAELAQIQRSLALMENAGLRPSAIDISEMALRNLTLLLPSEETEGRGVVLVRITEGAGSLGLFRDGSLYLSRQFELNYGGGLLDELPDEDLVLEIQRSLDYSERQMGQAPPSAIYLFGDNISEDKITDSITGGLSVPVRPLRLDTLPTIQTDQDDAFLQPCAGAIGAVLRSEGWS